MKGAFSTGKYRNLLVEMGYQPEDVRARVQATFDTIFFGSQEERLYFEVGDDMAYFTDTGNDDVRTEGMSYAMMMSVQFNRKDLFDRLWKWTVTYMYMEKGWSGGYFCWSNGLDGKKNSGGPAPDGEEYFALCLLFAAHRFGNGEGIFNYEAQAIKLLSDMIHKGEPGRLGEPMFDPHNKLIKFITNCDFSDPSYHLPHFYELFSLWADPADHLFWKEAASASRQYLHLACHPVTGLAPEYAAYDGTPVAFNGHHDRFFSDSYRVAANLGLDTVWFNCDPWQGESAARLQKFFCETVKDAPTKVYNVDGTVADHAAKHNIAIIATNAQGSLASLAPYSTDQIIDCARQTLGQPVGTPVENADRRLANGIQCVRDFWNTPLRTGKYRYYDNCLYLFAMMSLAGQYRIYPTQS